MLNYKTRDYYKLAMDIYLPPSEWGGVPVPAAKFVVLFW